MIGGAIDQKTVALAEILGVPTLMAVGVVEVAAVALSKVAGCGERIRAENLEAASVMTSAYTDIDGLVEAMTTAGILVRDGDDLVVKLPAGRVTRSVASTVEWLLEDAPASAAVYKAIRNAKDRGRRSSSPASRPRRRRPKPPADAPQKGSQGKRRRVKLYDYPSPICGTDVSIWRDSGNQSTYASFAVSIDKDPHRVFANVDGLATDDTRGLLRAMAEAVVMTLKKPSMRRGGLSLAAEATPSPTTLTKAAEVFGGASGECGNWDQVGPETDEMRAHAEPMRPCFGRIRTHARASGRTKPYDSIIYASSTGETPVFDPPGMRAHCLNNELDDLNKNNNDRTGVEGGESETGQGGNPEPPEPKPPEPGPTTEPPPGLTGLRLAMWQVVEAAGADGIPLKGVWARLRDSGMVASSDQFSCDLTDLTSRRFVEVRDGKAYAPPREDSSRTSASGCTLPPMAADSRPIPGGEDHGPDVGVAPQGDSEGDEVRAEVRDRPLAGCVQEPVDLLHDDGRAARFDAAADGQGESPERDEAALGRQGRDEDEVDEAHRASPGVKPR